MSNFSSVVIVVEGSGPTGGAERVAFETVELLSGRGIPVRIVSSASFIEERYLALPGVTGIALDLPRVWEKFFCKNRLLSFPLRNRDSSLAPVFRAALSELVPQETVVHVHGFHTYFTHQIMEEALNVGFRTHLHAHDYGFVCPIATLFNYPDNRICTLEPLSDQCKQSKCLNATDNELKLFRFRRAKFAFENMKIQERLTSILCPSPFARKIMAETLGDIPKLQVLRCPVEPAARERQFAEKSSCYLWIGRLTAEKDPRTALLAAQKAGIRLTLVGDGPLREALEKEFSDHDFLGWKSAEEVSALQRQARCLVMSSAWYETASLVVLECLAAGIPCIIGDSSAASSWLTNGENGLTFDNGSPDSLGKALEATKDGLVVERLSRNAFDRYWSDPCSSENYLTRLLEVYEQS